MGYRSDTTYAIVLKTEEDKNRLLARLPAEQLARLRTYEESGLREEPTRLLYHEKYVKWYASRHLAGVYQGFQDVDDHEALIAAAKEADFAQGDDHIDQVGVFIRVGEESDDIEQDVWGSPGEDGLPEWYELAEVQVQVFVGWEE